MNYRLKSEIKMNKRKLVQIIVKDLEEIKILSEEVAESQDDASLIIDLALNRARLLCQEIELLREFYGKSDTFQEESDDDFDEEDEDEVSDVSISDPEFEILNFEEKESPKDEELTEEEESVPEDESDLENLNEDEPEEDDLTEEDEDEEKDKDQEEQENSDKEVEKDDLVETDEVESVVDQVEEPQQTKNTQVTELKNDPKSGVRSIHIDDLDDNDNLEHIKFMPHSDSSYRPVMHEIPKPENPVQEKTLIGDSFQNERSVNDVLGENKADESNLNNGPISSLRAAIGLNDRFLFIREIFANNTDKYNTVIDQLDKLETIQQAVEYLKANLSLQKNDTSLKFVDLLKRRFSK